MRTSETISELDLKKGLVPWNLQSFSPATSTEQSHFKVAFFFVPSQGRRQALARFYSFCRLCDDLVDEDILPLEARAAALDCIEDWVRTKRSIGNKFWDEHLQDRLKFEISDEIYLGILNGVRIDLEKHLRIKTWKDLDAYVYGVAVCVGKGTLAILGAAEHSKANEYARNLGSCVQYLNIMRDLEADLERHDRVYIPREYLKQIQVEELPIEDRERMQWIREELFQRALEFRSRAKPYAWACLTGELMVGIYLEAASKYWRRGLPTRLSRLEKINACGSQAFKVLAQIFFAKNKLKDFA